MWRSAIGFGTLLLLVLAGFGVVAESAPPVDLAATVSATALRFADGVRYSVTALQPPDDIAHNLYVEITLPPGAELVEAFDSAQVVFRGERAGAGGGSLIWTAEVLAPDQPFGPFAFTLRDAAVGPLSVFIQWAGADPNRIGVISTYAAPEIREAANDIDFLLVGPAGTGDLAPVGATGVLLHVEAGAVSQETSVLVGEMSTALNPPPEYGAIWWCSGLALAGLPDGARADVIVPLRRPLPPLTTTTLFALQPDNSWQPLDQRGVVTFDGQYVAYAHPGGVIATGVEGDLQPAEQPPVEVPPAEAPPPPPPPAEPPPSAEPPPPPPPPEAIIPAEPPPPEPPPPTEPAPAEAAPTAEPLATVPPAAADASSSGSSSAFTRPAIPTPAFTRELIQIAPPTATPVGDGSVRLTPTPLPDSVARPTATLAGITDGSSNTILFGEATATPAPDQAAPTSSFSTLAPFQTATPVPTLANISDGSSNTILFGEATAAFVTGDGSVRPLVTATPVPTLTNISDGASNTLLIGEATAAFVTGDGSVRPLVTATPAPTLANISDGASNTLLIGEATATPAPDQAAPTGSFSTLAPFQTATPAPTLANISDGASNTLLIGEATAAFATGDGSVRPISFTPTATPTSRFSTLAPFQTATPAPTLANISDGASNTLLIGEATATPAPDQAAPTGSFSTLAPFQTATPAPTLANISDGSSNTILFGEATATPAPDEPLTLEDVVVTLLARSATATPTPAPDQAAPTATPLLDANGTPIAVGDAPPNGDDLLSGVQGARESARARGGVTSGVALEAIDQVFPGLDDGQPPAEAATATPSLTPTATPSPIPPLPTALLLATLTPASTVAPSATATLLPAPAIVTAVSLPACAPAGSESASASPCLAGAQTLQVCAPGANACLTRTLRQSQVCIQFADRRAPVCTRFGR